MRSTLGTIILRHRNENVKKCLQNLTLQKTHIFTFTKNNGQEVTVEKSFSSKNYVSIIKNLLYRCSSANEIQERDLQNLTLFSTDDLFIVCLSIKNANCL